MTIKWIKKLIDPKPLIYSDLEAKEPHVRG